MAPLRTGERRDARSGGIISSQNVHLWPEVPPSFLYSVFPFSKFRKSRPEKLGHTKLSVQLFTIRTPINVNNLSLPKGEKQFVMQWKAQLFDAQNRKLRQPLALFKCFDRLSGVGVSRSFISFCSSPDGKTLFIHAVIPALSDGTSINQDMTEWIEAFDTTTGRSLWKRFLMRHNKQNGQFRSIAFSPNSNVAALLNDKYQGGVAQSGNVELRNTRSGTILRQFKIRPLTQNYLLGRYTQFSPDGKLLAVPQNDRLELWDVSDLN